MSTCSCKLPVRAVPRAKRNEIAGVRHQALLVKVTAPPIKGAANAAIVKLVAKSLGIRPRFVRIVAGEKSRDKVLEIDGLTRGEVLERLGLPPAP